MQQILRSSANVTGGQADKTYSMSIAVHGFYKTHEHSVYQQKSGHTVYRSAT